MPNKTVPKYIQRRQGSLFDALRDEAVSRGITPRTQESMNWFRRNIRKIVVGRKSLLRDEALVRRQRPRVGSMFMYFYNAKHKETLPYWDAFPLIIMVGPAKDGFYGLNLHYLPPLLRARLLDRLMDNMTNQKYNERTRIRISYEFLKNTSRLRLFRPCFKHYLRKHVVRPMMRVEPTEWEIALFLPTEQFHSRPRGGIHRTEVWKESRRIIRSS